MQRYLMTNLKLMIASAAPASKASSKNQCAQEKDRPKPTDSSTFFIV